MSSSDADRSSSTDDVRRSVEASLRGGARRRHGLGLRAQILLVLGVAFVASFPLLGIAAVQLTQRARAEDRVRDAQATAHALASAVRTAEALDRPRFAELADGAIGHGGVAGVELLRPGLEPWARGAPEVGRAVEVDVDEGRALRLWLRPPEPDTSAPLANLLLLYVAMTGGAILLLVYVVMTYLIVRPIEAVTRASERLASGHRVAEAPVRGGAEVARLGVSFNDMADQLRKERSALEQRLEELERTTVELRSAQEQVVRTARLASVGRLSAGVAHEIGNPLSAILGLIELIRGHDDLDEGERDEFLARIQSETERINKIIRELLDFARQHPDDEDESGEADLREVVEDAVSLVAPQKDLRGVTIERRFDDALPPARGSADRLTQVVLNLLLNAADAIEREGSVVVAVRASEGPGGQPGWLSLTVEDSGPGIDEEVLEHLFEPFVTTKPAGQGTGLGLAVCHTIVERLGGTIEASNARGGGARLEVRLPAAP